MKKSILSLFVCLSMMASNASADFFGGGAGFAIPDNSPAGASSSIGVGAVGTVVSFDNIIIDVSVQHTWVGDVTLTLQSPTGTQVQLMRRPGASGFGNSGDWQVGAHTFVESGGLDQPTTNVAFNMAGGSTWNRTSNPFSTQIIPAANPNTFAAFNGESITGNWTLFGSDGAGGDTGAIGGWSMNITVIPEPSSILLLSAFGLVGLVRRRRI